MKKIYIIIPVMLITLLFLKFSVKSEGDISVSAQCAVLIDSESGRVLFEKDSNTQRPVASISKIMTALIAIENGNLDDVVTISKEASHQIGSSLYLKKGEKMLLSDLIYGLLLRSGNDAAYAIAEHVAGDVDSFVLLMNEKAKELGLHNTTFENPSGLDETNKNISTAYDMALITRNAMNNPFFREINNTSYHRAETLGGRVFGWQNKHRLIRRYDSIIGGKTGYTRLAKRTLVTVSRKDDFELIAVTLNGPNDWNDHKRMFDYGFNEFQTMLLKREGLFEVKKLNKIFYVDENIIYPLKNNEIHDYKFIIDVRGEKTFLLLVKHRDVLLEKEIEEYDATHGSLDERFTILDFLDGISEIIREIFW